ncbi:MAG TPA: hypothetical protein VHQ92_13385 [Pseudolabrys sp.]|nr:hypothetical protein [Pseudolabrys sp.]
MSPVNYPAPFTPRTADLRGLDTGIINVHALIAALKRKNHLARADMALKLASFEQLPAGSLPNDDAMLRDLADLTEPTYRTMRDRLMADWVLCSDGRLYHSGVAAMVMANLKRLRRPPAKHKVVSLVEKLEAQGQMTLSLADTQPDALSASKQDTARHSGGRDDATDQDAHEIHAKKGGAEGCNGYAESGYAYAIAASAAH